MEVTVPYNFHPRWYQELILKAIAKGYRRIIIILPRRAGKDLVSLNAIFSMMFREIGVYFYFFPEAKQARRTIWEGIHDGFRFMDHMPREAIKRKNESTMTMEIKGDPGSILTLMPGNEPDRVVGSNPIGCVYSEYAIMNPAIWDYTRPMLAQNGGLAIFPYTPRGDNHGFSLYNEALKHPDEWYVLRLDSTQTKHLHTDPARHFEILEKERRAYIALHGDDALFQQEYMCSFDAPLVGSYYGDIMRGLAESNRITDVPYDPMLPVHTTWDIGIDDETVVWFVQITPGGVWRWLGCIYGSNSNAMHFAQLILAKNYYLGNHYLPHDADHREPGSGLTYGQQLGKFLPPSSIKIVPRIPNKYDRITQVRNVLPKSVFDAIECRNGISALKSYRREWDNDRKTYRQTPEHDWSSHYADSIGQIIQAYKGEDLDAHYEQPDSQIVLDPY